MKMNTVSRTYINNTSSGYIILVVPSVIYKVFKIGKLKFSGKLRVFTLLKPLFNLSRSILLYF